MSGSWSYINASRRGDIKHVAVLPLPLSLTVTIIVSRFVNASSVVSTRIVHAFIPIVNLTIVSSGSQDTIASVPSRVCHTGAPIVAMVHQANIVLSVVTPRSRVASTTLTVEARTIAFNMTLTSVRTGVGGAEVLLDVTMTTSPSLFAVALIIVEELNTVRSAVVGAGVGQTLVDVSLAPGASVSCSTLASEASYLVNIDTSVETCSNVTIIKIFLTQSSLGSRRTGTFKLSHQVNAGTSIMTWVASTFIDVNLTLRTHKTLGTLTTVC